MISSVNVNVKFASPYNTRSKMAKYLSDDASATFQVSDCRDIVNKVEASDEFVEPILLLPHRITMVFDTETSGLLSRTEIPINKKPYILQLSYLLYDEDDQLVIERCNHYIRLEDMTIEIDKGAMEVHKITKEKLEEVGEPIVEILTKFYKDYMRSSVIVAHNINFDIEMILIEMERNYEKLKENGCASPESVFNGMFERVNGKTRYDTMEHGRDICNLWMVSKRYGKLGVDEAMCKTENGIIRMYKKSPKLSELWYKLKGVECEGLHDSAVDVEICKEVYLSLKGV